MIGAKTRAPVLLVCLLLGCLTAGLYWPVTGYGLISLDDPEYITWNPEIRQGLTLPALKWAFTTGYTGNWHPLTWVSYMLDYELLGGRPGAMHLTNLVLHIANSVLLFLLFRRMTAALWASAFLAALFALHPLHVESVAWVTERKDVLNTFFGLLALWAYVRYVEQSKIQGPKSELQRSRFEVRGSKFKARGPWSIFHLRSPIFYLLSLLLFALSLMSKSMLVTLPFLLLVLDYWPLRRWRNAECGVRNSAQTSHLPPAPRPPSPACSICSLLLEKLPFFALSLAFSVITFLAQKAGGAVVPTGLLPLPVRLGNALMAYWHYLGSAFWPTRLALGYPATQHWPVGQLCVAAGIVGGLTALALWKRAPSCLLTGWFWFLGVLVPVLGLVQVGSQTVADRFMYVPLVGLGICVAWGAPALLRKWPAGKALLALSAAAVLALCATLTHRQISYWKDSLTLFERTLRVTTNNIEARNLCGLALEAQGRRAEAIEHYREALRINPASPQSHVNLGCALGSEGNLQEALAHNLQALALKPDYPEAHDNVGVALVMQGKPEEAEPRFREAVRLRPSFAAARGHWAVALMQLGRLDEAIAQIREALRYAPGDAELHLHLSYALRQKGDLDQAISESRVALRLAPDDPNAHSNLAGFLLQQGKAQESLEHSLEALRLRPGFPQAHFNAGNAYIRLGQPTEALAQWQVALRLNPNSPELLNTIAWTLATHPDPKIRNGAEAAQLAQRACSLTESKAPAFLDTLAVAYAEAGKFDDAIKTAEEAIASAESSGQTAAADKFRTHAALFRAQKPYHEE